MANVSVIIPIYNVEPYIEECVQSVLNQTMTDGLECILVDDCGKDRSAEIAESVVNSYKGEIKIKFIHHGVNKGLSCARNNAVDAAEGKYVLFLDSDDYITPDCIETLWNLALKYPNADFVDGISYSLDKKQNDDFHLCLTKHHLPEYCDDADFIRRELTLNHYHINCTNALIKKEFLTSNNISFIQGVVFEDFSWHLDCSRKIKAIALASKDTYFYRYNENSIMNSINKKYIKSVAINSDHMLSGIDLGKFYRIELFKIVEFMHIYDDMIGECPLALMEFGKNKIFSKLYKTVFKKGGFFNKIYKELLIRLFKINMKLSR